MPDARGRAERLRTAAVVAVLIAGGAASVATSAPERCPDAEDDQAVSGFYGPQENSYGRHWWPARGIVIHGLDVDDVEVDVPGCLAGTTEARVVVALRFGVDVDGPVPEADVRTFTVTDGEGRSWSPDELSSTARSSEDDVPVDPARVWLAFTLPVDVVPPVTLHLGALADGTTDSIPLDEPPEREDG